VATTRKVERSERPSEVGAALALQANGMAVLDRLGLLGQVAAESVRKPSAESTAWLVLWPAGPARRCSARHGP
jgi:2-polyprenyl-6-methoxyphenol hydroxylase-like FAD-dependent oxidoreductase